MYPELSFEEKETGAFLSSKLREKEIDHTDGWAGYGLVGSIGDLESDNITALRGDMDALPIKEANDVSYKSRNEGVMHACGHDVHSSCLLGAAFILKEFEEQLPGGVKLIFQPGEERLPGGASKMIEEGVLRNPIPQTMFGQHVHPPLEVGKIGMKPGKYMASADEVEIAVIGKGGHAAVPTDVIDPVTIASEIILGLQKVVSRMSDPSVPTVLSFGRIESERGAFNVIPDEVRFWGTLRTMDEEWREAAHGHIKTIADQIAAAYGAHAHCRINKGYPALINDLNLTQKVRQWAVELLGDSNVVDLPERMTAEDFAYFARERPATFFRLGTGNARQGITSPIHTNTFDIDEEALKIGMASMAWFAWKALHEE